MRASYGYALVGVLALLGFVVYSAPATLLAAVLGDIGAARLTQVQGSIWDGAAAAEYGGQSLGALTWRFDASGLAKGQAVFDWQLADTGHALSGSARLGLAGMHCQATGTVRGAAMRRILARYWIEAEGDIGILRIGADLTYDLHPKNMVGELSWNGGEVRYRLAGEHHQMVLPPLTGVLETDNAEPALTVFGEGVPAPLLHVRLGADGWLDIGVTKMLTQMAGFPWPGNEPDHAIVIDVSERLIYPRLSWKRAPDHADDIAASRAHGMRNTEG